MGAACTACNKTKREQGRVYAKDDGTDDAQCDVDACMRRIHVLYYIAFHCSVPVHIPGYSFTAEQIAAFDERYPYPRHQLFVVMGPHDPTQQYPALVADRVSGCIYPGRPIYVAPVSWEDFQRSAQFRNGTSCLAVREMDLPKLFGGKAPRMIDRERATDVFCDWEYFDMRPEHVVGAVFDDSPRSWNNIVMCGKVALDGNHQDGISKVLNFITVMVAVQGTCAASPTKYVVKLPRPESNGIRPRSFRLPDLLDAAGAQWFAVVPTRRRGDVVDDWMLVRASADDVRRELL